MPAPAPFAGRQKQKRPAARAGRKGYGKGYDKEFGKGYGDALRAPARQGWAGAATANVKVMEMHQGRRPVYGGAPRQEPTGMAAQRYRAGGPGVLRTPGRRPPHRNGGTFGSFSHERTTIIRYIVKKMAAKLSRQVSCKATPARPIKKKSTCTAGRGAGVPRNVTAAARPPGGSMILPYRGKGNFPIKGGPCGVVDVSLPAASPFIRRVLSPEPVGEGQ